MSGGWKITRHPLEEEFALECEQVCAVTGKGKGHGSDDARLRSKKERGVERSSSSLRSLLEMRFRLRLRDFREFRFVEFSSRQTSGRRVPTILSAKEGTGTNELGRGKFGAFPTFEKPQILTTEGKRLQIDRQVHKVPKIPSLQTVACA